MLIFVFSYNRGEHLRNCLSSIKKCAPNEKTVIFDDESTDPETIKVLNEYSKVHEIHINNNKDEDQQHGGLYQNMQKALERAPDNETILFLQDDTQIVRPITNNDLTKIAQYFESNPRAGFLSPAFRCGITRKRVLDRFVYQPNQGVYFCEHKSKKKQAGVYYSDISVTTSDRLRSVKWQFLEDEFRNEQQAKQHFQKMGYMFAPFAMWLPNAPAYRFKEKSFLFRLGERINKSGLYSFEIMTPEQIAYLHQRPPEKLAIAENHLSIGNGSLRKPWIFDPLRRPWWLRRIAKITHKINKLYNSKT